MKKVILALLLFATLLHSVIAQSISTYPPNLDSIFSVYRARIAARDFGIYGDQKDYTTQFNNAIDYLNANPNSCLVLPTGIIGITASLHAITASNWCIEGEGGGSTIIQVLSSGGTTGTIFTIGVDGGTSSTVGFIKDVVLYYNNTPDGTQYPINILNASDVIFDKIRFVFAPGIVNIGGSTSKASRITFLNIYGSVNASLPASWISIVRAANIYFVHPVFNSSTSGVGTGSYVSIAPNGTVANGTDTIYLIDGNFQDTAGGGNTSYGITLNHTNGRLVNVWVKGGSYDHTHVSAINIIQTASPGGDFLRYIRFDGVRGVPDDGQAIIVSNAGTVVQDFIEFSGSNFEYIATAGATVTGNVNGFGYTSGSLVQQNATNHITAAFSMGVSKFRIEGVRVGRRSGGTCNTDYAVATTADVDNFTVVGNSGVEDLNTGVISNFAYATYSPQRITLGNTGNTDQYLVPPASGNLTLIPNRMATISLSSPYTNATTNYTDTNLTVSVAASTTYRIVAQVSGSNDTNSDGMQMTVSAPTGATGNITVRGQAASAATTTAKAQMSPGDNSNTMWNNATGGTAAWATIDGTITTGVTAGSLTVRGKAVTGGTITFAAGSYIRVEKVGLIQ